MGLFNNEFRGKVVAITGAASGIGAATVARFAEAGASFLLGDLNLEGMQELVARLKLPADRIVLHRVDVANLNEVEGFIQAGIDRFGRLDVLINNAGMGSFGTVDQLPPETWSQVLGVNLDSVFFGARCAVPHLAKTRGCIINTASISGLGGDYGFAAYNAAKAGVINLTRTLAMDHAHQGIRVNAVCPGLVLTPIAAALHQTPQIMDAYRQMIPMGRACEPDEIARPILFLASSAASYITGEALVIDGGVRASAGQPNFKTLLAPLLEHG